MANGQQTTSVDPFGAFLMAAYLKGAMPGGQGISNFNTVLDLMSPGAVAGREEAGVPNLQEMYANMFGATPQQDELEQALAIQLGIAPGPKERATIGAAEAEAFGKMSTEQIKAAQAESEFARTFGLEQAKAGIAARKTEAETSKLQAEAAILGKPDIVEMQRRFDLNIDSLAMWGLPVNDAGETIDIEISAENADILRPLLEENKARASKYLALKQSDAGTYQAIAALLNNDQDQAAFSMLQRLYPEAFEIQDLNWLQRQITGLDQKLVPAGLAGAGPGNIAGSGVNRNKLNLFLQQDLANFREQLKAIREGK